MTRICPMKDLSMRPYDDFRVVCLGGSAGGLKPYLAILSQMPSDTGMAFVVAQHRAPDNSDLLPHLLSKATKMPVIEVVQGTRIEPNCVYVMPPRTNMTLHDGYFRLSTQVWPDGWPKTINVFLCSLAKEIGARTVAVILSGLDGDGSAALKTIKAEGGITFAQSDAAFDSMPETAVDTGHIDHLMSADDIAIALKALAPLTT
jgi:two-component system, chemotaxis family, CheB/CheR fusion protein